MKKETLGLVIVGVVLMGILIGRAFGDETTMPQQPPAQLAGIAEDVPSSVPQAAEPIRDPFESQEEAGFASAPVMATVSDIQVDGVGIGNKNAYALLNGETFFEGETKNGIKLVRVGKEEVNLLVNGSPRKIKLIPEDEIQRLQKRKEQIQKQEENS
jgi:hypothetical protein